MLSIICILLTQHQIHHYERARPYQLHVSAIDKCDVRGDVCQCRICNYNSSTQSSID